MGLMISARGEHSYIPGHSRSSGQVSRWLFYLQSKVFSSQGGPKGRMSKSALLAHVIVRFSVVLLLGIITVDDIFIL